MQAIPHRVQVQVCVCVCVSHTLVMERNDTVIAVFSPPPPFLSRARLKVCVGKKINKYVCVCSNVCVCASEVCVSLTAASSLSPATSRASCGSVATVPRAAHRFPFHLRRISPEFAREERAGARLVAD